MRDRLQVALTLGIGAGVVYALWKLGQAGKQATNAIARGVADVWVSLTSSAPITAAGNVVAPDGTVHPIAQLTWKTDAQGNTVTLWTDGQLYALAPRDANGDFTLTPYAGAS